MARGSSSCKKAIGTASKTADHNLKNTPYNVRGTHYLHELKEQDQETLVGSFGIAFVDPETGAEKQYFENSALTLVCLSHGARTALSYRFEDLPLKMQSGFNTGSITNEEVQQFALDLEDSKITEVYWAYTTDGLQQAAIVGHLPTGSDQDRRRLGIRSASGSDLGSLRDSRVILPEDADFSNAVTRVDQLDTAVSAKHDSALAQAGL